MTVFRSEMAACVLAVLGCLPAAQASARGCVPDRSALPENVLSGYRANPADLLADDGRGGGLVSSRVRNAVASDSGMVDALAPSMKAAEGDGARSIGIGLGSAAQICSREFPALSQAIQRAVEQSGNPAVQQAFASVIGDQAVLSTGAGAGGGSVPGEATPGGGPHRPTEEPTYGFTSAATSISQPTFGSAGTTRSSTRSGSSTLFLVDTTAFRSASGVH